MGTLEKAILANENGANLDCSFPRGRIPGEEELRCQSISMSVGCSQTRLTTTCRTRGKQSHDSDEQLNKARQGPSSCEYYYATFPWVRSVASLRLSLRAGVVLK